MTQTFSAAAGAFQHSTLSSPEVDRLESFLVPLADSVGALVDATIRTTVDEAGIREVTGRIEAATALLRSSQLPGPAGVHVNTASARNTPTMTGTLTLLYRRACPLGPVRIEGRIDRREGYKTIVLATICDEVGVTVEAEGIFILPRWARAHFPIDPEDS